MFRMIFCLERNRKATGGKRKGALPKQNIKKGAWDPLGINWVSLLFRIGYFRQFWQVFRKSRETPVVLAIHSSWYSGAK